MSMLPRMTCRQREPCDTLSHNRKELFLLLAEIRVANVWFELNSPKSRAYRLSL
jgi:hypothetical protein